MTNVPPAEDLDFPINVSEPEEVINDFQAGRVGAVHRVGEAVEKLVVEQEQLVADAKAMKSALHAVGKNLEKFRDEVNRSEQHARLPIKEAEIAKNYITKCIIKVKEMFNDAVRNQMLAEGGASALGQAVQSIKRIYDEEHAKFRQQEDYLRRREELTAKEKVRERPVGMSPGNPLEEMKREVDSPAAKRVVKVTKNASKRPRM